jgi:hypothetical protein
MFVRFMINIEAKKVGWKDPETKKRRRGVGYPVGWAVRGFLPEELARRNARKAPGETIIQNSYNLLPVFRGDFRPITTRSTEPKGVAKEDHWSLERMYWISTDPRAQMIQPRTLISQIDLADPDPPLPLEEKPVDNTNDIANGRWGPDEPGPVDTPAPSVLAQSDTDLQKERTP